MPWEGHFGPLVPLSQRVLGEPAFAEAARAIAAEIAEMDTVDEAATAFEEFIAGG